MKNWKKKEKEIQKPLREEERNEDKKIDKVETAKVMSRPSINLDLSTKDGRIMGVCWTPKKVGKLVIKFY